MKASKNIIKRIKVEHQQFYQDMHQLSDLSEQSYRELTENNDGFLSIFMKPHPSVKLA